MYWLDDIEELVFPHPKYANDDGILAVGGDLSPQRLVLAYENGIFPWFNEGDPILWWAPNPRFVLFPQDLKISKSMRPYFNQQKFDISMDQRFKEVMIACQQSKRGGKNSGTWITDDMLEAYEVLHQLGLAHSVEVWQEGELVGGLYGVALGKIFFGESMFTRVSNASKYGFIFIVKKLIEKGFVLIDCQQTTKHLASLGAKEISRTQFMEYIEANKQEQIIQQNWEAYFQ